ncbi:MAG: superoxide dismutase family protein [Paracoccus denitrificans]|uniref:Superoxide dismutase [Cu-Zn] n=1 Tax=Paracoccus denitrificans TaxID=266 RepID=A0A533I3T2_PARDE|nr:MAG: superoxide dismutase family protein [Paracoccus denitrificans]
MKLSSHICTILVATACGTGAAMAQDGAAQTDAAPQPITADIADADGNAMGNVELSFSESGLAVVALSLSGVPAGEHAIHFHTVGRCEAPFESAEGHLSADMDHGVMSAKGPHPGDMPNMTIPENGEHELTYFVPGLTEELVNDDDGTALIIHAGADDYQSQPSGDAGDRLACAVIAPAS